MMPDVSSEEAHVMEAVRRLAAGVAHDLNNLLLVVQGYTEMAFAEEDAGPQTLGHLEEVRNASVRAASLAEDLLTVGLRGRSAPRMHQINDCITRNLRSLRAAAAEGVEIRVALAPALPVIMCDQVQMARLARALCARAWAVMPAGGVLTIGTAVTEPGPAGERRVLLTFSDTGAAVPPELRKRLFEPYVPWKPDGKGLGLELSIAHSIVHSLGGEIEVQCPPQGGTTIVLSFPVRPEARDEHNAPPPRGSHEMPHTAADGPIAAAQTILLAEDDEGLRTLAMKVLVREGYNVLAARDGQEAFEIFELNKGAICLALMDEVMPRMSGRVALARMRGILPGLPAILCTGYMWSLNGKAREYGEVLDILPKPWLPRELVQRVREALAPSRPRSPGATGGP